MANNLLSFEECVSHMPKAFGRDAQGSSRGGGWCSGEGSSMPWQRVGAGKRFVVRGAVTSHVNQQISLNYVRVLCGWIAHYMRRGGAGQGKWWERAKAQREEIELLPQTPQSEREREKDSCARCWRPALCIVVVAAPAPVPAPVVAVAVTVAGITTASPDAH